MAAKDPTAAVRSAVDRTFQATVGGAQVTKDRAQELVEEVSQAATKVKAVIDDLRVATGEDIRVLEERIELIGERLERIETVVNSLTAKKPPVKRRPKPAATKAKAE